ncbi:phosphotransferase [Clostridium swellfunianum]|uniref:phosphotransferase enzyme family protein n=1 Tax=Clostridium swellfunianum TaxID=1367462 RepID=UPI00202E3603|nr:phosphotransferase [Clostridium swellfunianum]MCM0647341.1 phosphotransferase [Clostridium swellfunianum]
MEKDIRDDIIKKIISELAERYAIRHDDLESITGGYQNLIFEFVQNDKPHIFRISDSVTRSEEMIKSELEWCIYLFEHGVPLSRPLKSTAGHLTETVYRDGIKMTATLFEKAPGRKMAYPEYLNNVEVFKRLGQITGKIHKASKNYNSPNIKRNNWFQNYYLTNLYKYVPETEINIRNAYEDLMKKLNLLNCNQNSFGLIHGDINVGNFCISDNQITLFDFDECQYSWFVEDIAIQLFYTVYVFGDDSINERQEMADKFMSNFMSGYNSENYLDSYWIEKIPEFLKLRELIVYIGIYKKWKLNNLSEWQRDYYNQSTNRIKSGISLVDYRDNWNKLSI